MMTVPLMIILWTLGFGFLGILAIIVRHVTYWRFKGISYIDTVPIFGLMFSVFVRKKSIVEMTQDCYNCCPGAKYFGCMGFMDSLLIIKDPDIVKDICVKSFDYFPNHYNFVKEEFDPIFSRNLFSLKNNRWREMRSTLSPSFTANKMKYMFDLVSKCSSNFNRYLIENSELTEDIDLRDIYSRYTNDVIATTAFGISVDSFKYRNNEFYVNGKDVSNMDGFVKILKIFTARVFPKLMRFFGLSLLSSRSDKFFKTLIYDTVKARNENGISRPDMIQLLLQARDNENGVEITTEDIIAQAFIFFIAGFDTSSRLLCFVSHVLSHHPEIQDRLRDEVDTILSDEDGNITYDTLERMRYMDRVILETLRIYPPVPFTDRTCEKPYELPPSVKHSRPFTVRKDDIIWIPIFGFHRDPRYFPEPEKFDPERFNDENKNNIKPYTYMPFGIGPRKCIGERFALMGTKILIARLLRNFVLKPSEKTTKLITFARDASLMTPKNGFWMRLEPRRIQQ